MVRGISEISDPPLVTTTTFLLLKIKLYPQIYKNRGAREPTRGNKRKITDYTDFIIRRCKKSFSLRPRLNPAMTIGMHIRVSSISASEIKALAVHVATMLRPRYVRGHGKQTWRYRRGTTVATGAQIGD